METNVMKATKRSSRGGYRDTYMKKMNIIATHDSSQPEVTTTSSTPPALSRLLQSKNLRKIITDGKDETTTQMLELKKIPFQSPSTTSERKRRDIHRAYKYACTIPSHSFQQSTLHGLLSIHTIHLINQTLFSFHQS